MRFLLSKQRGFTLIEILVALSIVAVLSSVIYGTLQEGRKKARDAQRTSDLSQIQLSLRMYRDATTTGAYPNIPNGELIGDGVGLEMTASSTLPVTIKDPMVGATYGYYYDSAYICNGVSRTVLIAIATEQTATKNFAKVCGGIATSTTLTNTVTPSATAYIVILK